MKRTIALLTFLIFAGCTGPITPQQEAILTTAGTVARIAAQAAATYYGGPAAGALASAGLDALAVNMQAYIGHPIPPGVVKAAPGVEGVGAALVPLIAPNHVVTPADAAKVERAAAIAKTLKPAFTPATVPQARASKAMTAPTGNIKTISWPPNPAGEQVFVYQVYSAHSSGNVLEATVTGTTYRPTKHSTYFVKAVNVRGVSPKSPGVKD